MRASILPLAIAAAVLAGTTADAATITLDTTPLAAMGGTSYLDFQLADSDSGVNTVQIQGITLGGGTHLDAPPDGDILTGDATGTFPDYALGDTQFFNQVLIPFTAGTSVQFTLTSTANYLGGGSPDTFTWAVLNANFESIVSDGLGAGLVLLLDGSGPQFVAATRQYSFITPRLVPEPATGLLMLTAAGLLARVRRRRNLDL